MSAFFPLPAWLVRRSDVSWPAKVLFAVLVRYTKRGTREAFPAIDTLVRDMASPRRSVERWLFELEHAGIVERERTGRACTFRMAIEPEPMPASSGVSAERPDSATDGASSSAIFGGTSAKVGASDPPELAHQPPVIPFTGGVEISIEGERARAWVREYDRWYREKTGGPGPSIAGHLPKLLETDPVRACAGFFGTARMAKTRPPFDPKYLAEKPEGWAACAPRGPTNGVSDLSAFEPSATDPESLAAAIAAQRAS